MTTCISYYKEVTFLVRTVEGLHEVGPQRIPMWVLGACPAVPYGYAEYVAKELAARGFSRTIPGGRSVIAPAAILEVSYELPEWTFGEVW